MKKYVYFLVFYDKTMIFTTEIRMSRKIRSIEDIRLIEKVVKETEKKARTNVGHLISRPSLVHWKLLRVEKV